MKLKYVYRWLGVDHVHIVENSANALHGNMSVELAQFIDDGFITLVHDTTLPIQNPTYARCIKQYRKQYNWIAFIDLDEFIAVRDKCALQLRWVAQPL